MAHGGRPYATRRQQQDILFKWRHLLMKFQRTNKKVKPKPKDRYHSKKKLCWNVN